MGAVVAVMEMVVVAGREERKRNRHWGYRDSGDDVDSCSWSTYLPKVMLQVPDILHNVVAFGSVANI